MSKLGSSGQDGLHGYQDSTNDKLAATLAAAKVQYGSTSSSSTSSSAPSSGGHAATVPVSGDHNADGCCSIA
jgi:hypothetical protein